MKTSAYMISEFWGDNSIRKVRTPLISIEGAKEYASSTQIGPHTMLQIEDKQGHCVAINKKQRGWVDFDMYGRPL